MKAKTKRNLLVTLADKNYIEQAKQLFSSVYFNAGWEGDYMLLAHEIPEKELKWFKEKEILINRCKSISNKNSKYWPVCLLDKFFLFKPEFKKWKNVIYLDADIIVRASLDKLTEIKGFAAFGNQKLSRHFLGPLHIKLKLKKINKNILNKLKRDYNFKEISFNGGVMAFSTDIIKKDSFAKLKKLFELYDEVNYTVEEVPLNLFFYKKYQNLPIVYNINVPYLNNIYNIKPKKIKGIILHFQRDKLWNPKSHFYKEWKSNLEKADLINLKRIPPARKSWTAEEINGYSQYLRKREIIYFYRAFIWEFFIIIDKSLGLFGIFLKNNFPKLYYKLKKLKDKL